MSEPHPNHDPELIATNVADSLLCDLREYLEGKRAKFSAYFVLDVGVDDTTNRMLGITHNRFARGANLAYETPPEQTDRLLTAIGTSANGGLIAVEYQYLPAPDHRVYGVWYTGISIGPSYIS